MKLAKHKLEFVRRRLAFEEALSSHRLEGLEPDPETIEDLKCYVRGEISIEESIKRFRERVIRGDF